MDKIKMLVVTTSGLAKKEGIATVILDYFRLFDKNRFDLTIVAQGNCSPELRQEFLDAGFQVCMLPSRKFRFSAYLKGFRELCEKGRFDALYIHGSSAMMSVELGIARLYGCKIRVVHSHNTTCSHITKDRLMRPLFRALYTDALACGTDAGKWLYDNRDFCVVKNGRDVEKYRFDSKTRTELRAALGLDENTLAVGHVGNFNAQKNQAFALRVFQELLSLRKDARMYFMGSGSMMEQVQQQAAELGIADQIVFTGSIPNVGEMLQAMDVMLLPSLHEGLPLVVVEWQIAALPCLISDKVTAECAYSDLVHFMPLEDPKAWAARLLEISGFDREAAAEEMVRKTVENGYDITHNAEQLQKFFTDRCGK